MIFDTAAGELTPGIFQTEVTPQLELLTQKHSARIGYYSKGTQPAHLRQTLFTGGRLAGVGVDYRWDMAEALEMFPHGFVQGNFDPALLLGEPDELKKRLTKYLEALNASRSLRLDLRFGPWSFAGHAGRKRANLC